MELKIKKIQDKELNLSVSGQGCLDDCKVTIWKGKTASDYSSSCWSSSEGYNARTTSWW